MMFEQNSLASPPPANPPEGRRRGDLVTRGARLKTRRTRPRASSSDTAHQRLIMTRRRRTPPFRNPNLLDPQVIVNGYELRRIDGLWCARTRGGTWRSAAWLGVVTVDSLLDHLYEQETPPCSSPSPSSPASV